MKEEAEAEADEAEWEEKERRRRRGGAGRGAGERRGGEEEKEERSHRPAAIAPFSSRACVVSKAAASIAGSSRSGTSEAAPT